LKYSPWIGDGSLIDNGLTQFFQMTQPSFLNPYLITAHTLLASTSLLWTTNNQNTWITTPTMSVFVATLSRSLHFALSLLSIQALESFHEQEYHDSFLVTQSMVDVSVSPSFLQTISWKMCGVTLLTYAGPTTIVTCTIRSLSNNPIYYVDCLEELATRLNYGINECYLADTHFMTHHNQIDLDSSSIEDHAKQQPQLIDEHLSFIMKLGFCILICWLFGCWKKISSIINTLIFLNYFVGIILLWLPYHIKSFLAHTLRFFFCSKFP
jgi:hypothetical protein